MQRKSSGNLCVTHLTPARRGMVSVIATSALEIPCSTFDIPRMRISLLRTGQDAMSLQSEGDEIADQHPV
jgi:hypothetical protein